MTDLEFQLLNERGELRATINRLRAELHDTMEREEIAKKVIADQRKEIYELRGKK